MRSVGRIVIPGFIALFGLASVAGAQNPGRAAGVIGDRLHAGGVLGVGRAPQSSVMDLTLDDAVKRALERNLDIAVEEINPQVQDLTLAEQQAFYRPTLGFNMDNTARTYPASTQLDGGRVTETGTQNLNLSINQPVKWGGGSFSVGLNNMRSETTNFFSSFNPSFRAIFNTTFTQPLLRGFRTDFNRQQLRVTRVNRDIADIDLRQMVTNTVTDVRNAYWDLLYASASVGVQQEALDLAEQLVRDNRARVEIGTLAPIEVVNAQAQAAASREVLVAARQTLRTAELALKRLIVDGTEDPIWPATLNPVDEPDLDYPSIDIDTAIRVALDQRTDLARIERQQEVNRLNVATLHNNTLPQLDLVGTYQLQGQGGDYIDRRFFGGSITQVIPGGYRDAIDQIASASFPTWIVGLQLSYPIGSSAHAALERARLQVRQTEAEERRLRLAVATEVTNAALQVESTRERIDASRAARELAEQQLDAEESKFEVGMSTNFFVVQAQRDLSAARDTELRAVLDYQKALIEFERVQRTALVRSGISLVGGGAAIGSTANPAVTSGAAGGGGFGGGGFGGGGFGGGGFGGGR